MTNIIKKVLSTLQVVLLVVAFFFALYINVYMFFDLGKNPFGRDFFNFFGILTPFVLLIILYFINFVNNHHNVNNSIFYKIVSILVIITIIYMEYRSVFDNNMILWYKTDYHINFDYFTNQILPIKIMIYGLCIVNIFYIIEGYLDNNKEKSNV